MDAIAYARKNIRHWAAKYMRFREPVELIRDGIWGTMQTVINEYEYWFLSEQCSWYLFLLWGSNNFCWDFRIYDTMIYKN